MPTTYNKVVIDGTTLMDISDTTATASDVALGKYFYTTGGVKTEGTATSGNNAISVVDTLDSHGGTIRTITAVDISDTTAIASDVASGKYFYTSNGTKTLGTGGGSSSPTLVTKEITANGTYTASSDSADGYSSVTVNVPSSGITPTGSINITTNGTHDVTNYASAVVNVSGSGGSSATQHSIYFEFIDSTNATIPIYYDDSSISSIITTSKPFIYNNKQVTLAQLDGTTWYSPKAIPLNTQLIDYTKMKDHYGLSGEDGTEEEYEWSSVTDYIPIDRNMTFTYVNYKWYALYFYDTNKTYIRSFSPNDNGATIDEYNRGHGTLDGGNIPSGAEYVRFVTELEANDASEASLIRIT